MFAAGTAQAQNEFAASLTHGAEPPPAGTTLPTTSLGVLRPTPFGFATFSLNAAETQLTMSATVFNIDVTGSQTADPNDNLVAAHIHNCDNLALPVTPTCGVRWGFFGAPDNDNNPDQFVLTPFATGVGGVFTSIWDQPEGNAGTTLTSNLPAIRLGRSYINFHTVQFGGGEIRGALLVAPEPSTYALMGTGLLALVGIARRRRA
jgi:hypothetical protein